ncbi:MAG: aminotransferase class IV [Sphingomicrobium sp.]
MSTAHDCAHHHFRRYTRRQLGWLFREAGYRIQLHSFFNSLLFPAIAGARLIGKLRGAQSADDALPSPPINAALEKVFGLEAGLIGRARCRSESAWSPSSAADRALAIADAQLHRCAMAQSMHDVSDPRNASILINVNGELKPRAQAVVSVFDSGFMLGDGVWEGLRVYDRKLLFLDRHLDRLFEGAKALTMDVGLTGAELTTRLYDTLDANGMSDGVHVRLMVTRGVRSTPYQDPRVVVTPATIVIIAEYKKPDPAVYERGLKLFTVHVRRGDPAVQDQKINSHSKLNCILASIQATHAGADEALMLDPHGFVATCNSTHFFIVRKGELWTSSGKYCLGGITRSVVLEIAREAGIPTVEKDFSLTDVYGADEAFVTGTFAGIVPIREVDGRKLDLGRPMTKRLRQLYAEQVEREVAEQRRP